MYTNVEVICRFALYYWLFAVLGGLKIIAQLKRECLGLDTTNVCLIG